MSIATVRETAAQASRSYERYPVSVQEYVAFHEQGFLIVRGLIPPEDTQEMIEHTEDLLAGRVSAPEIVGLSDKLTPDQQIAHWTRAHMLHRILPIHERFLLHPRTLDVLEALIGPDVLALQSMLFFKQPGQDGQGYHQDSYYIPSFPDTLCGAWVAIERADEENGCMWMTVGSQHEPIYPDVQPRAGHNTMLGDIAAITGASSTDEALNGLTPVARKYAGREVKALLQRALAGALEPRPALRRRFCELPAYSRSRQHASPIRAAALRHALRGQPARPARRRRPGSADVDDGWRRWADGPCAARRCGSRLIFAPP